MPPYPCKSTSETPRADSISRHSSQQPCLKIRSSNSPSLEAESCCQIETCLSTIPRHTAIRIGTPHINIILWPLNSPPIPGSHLTSIALTENLPRGRRQGGWLQGRKLQMLALPVERWRLCQVGSRVPCSTNELGPGCSSSHQNEATAPLESQYLC